MSQHTIFRFTCDLCKKEEEVAGTSRVPEPKSPPGWVRLNKPTEEWVDRPVHVCQPCAKEVADIVVARSRPETSQDRLSGDRP